MTTDKEKYAEMLDRIYELEGLLQLAITRDDIPACLGGLISRKISELTLTRESAPSATPDATAPAHDLFYVTEEAEEEIAPPAPTASPSAPVAVPPVPVAPTTPPSDLSNLSNNSNNSNLSNSSNSSNNPNPSDNPAPVPSRPKVSGRAVFNLNDRFRFRRSLFGGSDADFSEAIAMLPTFDSFDEASSWFYNDRGWNPEDPEVTAFMEVMKNYYL